MKVVVVGAGYAGTLAANRVAKKLPEAEITVVNPRPEFVERVRLQEQIAGTGTASRPLSWVLRDEVTAHRATVDKIGDGGVQLESGEALEFDYLFLAVGSTDEPLPGTLPVGTWEAAEQVRASLAELPTGRTVTVIGGGPTGIEIAAEIAYARSDLDVALIGDVLAETFTDAARQRLRTGLERLGVSVVEGTVAEASVDGAGEVVLRSGARLPSDLTLWAITGSIPDLARRSGLQVDDRGRVVVDEYLRSVSDSRIFAVGDCAAVPGSRAACYTAGPQGVHAADTLVRLVRGRRPEPFSLGYLGTCVSLGRRDAVLQFSYRDDSPRRRYLGGRPASMINNGVAKTGAYAVRAATLTWISAPE